MLTITKSIAIPQNVQITVNNLSLAKELTVQKGSIVRTYKLYRHLSILVDQDQITIGFTGDDRLAKQHINTAYSIIRSCMIGLEKEFTKELVMKGVGYKASVTDNQLVMNVAFCHPVVLDIPKHVSVRCPSPTEINVSSPFKDFATSFASVIRLTRKANVYQGIGIRYKDTPLKLKAIKKK